METEEEDGEGEERVGEERNQTRCKQEQRTRHSIDEPGRHREQHARIRGRDSEKRLTGLCAI